MRFVIPLTRAYGGSLLKAFSRSTGTPAAAHKYIRRERSMVGGKLVWIYWYADDLKREAHKDSIDPDAKHVHHLIADLVKLYPHLKSKNITAAEATATAISEAFGGETLKGNVIVGDAWNKANVAPFIESEKASGEGTRSPNARILAAVNLMSEETRRIVGLGKGGKKKKGKRTAVEEVALAAAVARAQAKVTDFKAALEAAKKALDTAKESFNAAGDRTADENNDIARALSAAEESVASQTAALKRAEAVLARAEADQDGEDHGESAGGATTRSWGNKAHGVTKFWMVGDGDDPEKYLEKYGAAAFYRPNTGEIQVGQNIVTVPIGDPNFNGSLTRTEKVVLHEIGHARHFIIEIQQPGLWDDWKRMRDTEQKFVSNYAQVGNPRSGPDSKYEEDFAETFACAHTHPKELAMVAPEHYEWMRENVLHELRPLAEMLATPDEELRWWNAAPVTPVSKLLHRARHESPASTAGQYYSDKDQFYTMTVNGRTVMMRVGPASKDEEAGWDRMPATIDPVTQLPRYEGSLFNKFRSREYMKEIYDEKGNLLDSDQATLFLGQGDAKIEKFVAELGDDPIAAYTKLYDKKGKLWEGGKTNLGRKIFNALGGNLGNATDEQMAAGLHLTPEGRAKIPGTLEFERRRVAKLHAKGEDAIQERHEWTPVEISPEEFMAKSGTFKFNGIRLAPPERQTMQARETVDGKSMAQTFYDPVTGKHEPVLTAKLYEQRNPDGTWTKIWVNASNAFATGDKIKLPDGNGNWRWTVLTEDMPTDPHKLAKQIGGCTGASILAENHRYGRGQIMDPVLASLLNPGGRVDIQNAGDLIDLMRKAAEATEPRRTWVSISGKAEQGAERGLAHIEVEWDGKGPPKVVGDYWARQLGKSSIRIDELLDANNEIRLPRVIDRRGEAKKKVPIKPGVIGWILYPGSDKRILARVIKRAKDGWTVMPEAGQGAGIKQVLLRVDAVTPREAGIIPATGKKDVRRRFVEPLQSHVLLYADEVVTGSAIEEGSGVIRIKLPKDGSMTRDRILQMEGVYEPALDPDQDADDAPIGINISDLPALRKALGGFMMEDRVRAMLDIAMVAERSVSEQVGRKNIAKTEDFIQPNGNINPDGLLRGMRADDDGFQPGEHRITALQKLANNGGRMMAAHFMGTGKTGLAIMASAMMRNLVDGNGAPHPNRTSKKTVIVVPLNTAENWFQEFKQRAGYVPTLAGAATLAGAQQLPKLPPRGAKDTDEAFRKKVIQHWKDQIEKRPGMWDPFNDTNNELVCPYEYFRDHSEALLATGLFDGMVVDEAHKIANDNEVSKAVERWNPHMKLFLAMTGTPVNNTLHTVPRLLRLITAGAVDLGTEDQFENEYLVASATQRALGVKNPRKLDLNPMRAGKLARYLFQYFDVKNTTDVKGQNMPAVLLDENQPAHMTGMQAVMYRAAMAQMSDEDRTSLESSASLGLDETELLSEEAKASVARARGIANCAAYKAPDASEELQYDASVALTNKRGEVTITTVPRTFKLPSYEEIMDKKTGWNGKWPSIQDVADEKIHGGYFEALQKYSERLFGVDYSTLAGTKIDPTILKQIKERTYTTVTGQKWTDKVLNQDYGPEGMIARGTQAETGGVIEPIPYKFTDEHGHEHIGVVPNGTLFVRDSTAKAKGMFYASSDWDHTGRMDTSGEEGEDVGDSDDKKTVKQLKAAGWTEHPEDNDRIWNPDTGEERKKPKLWDEGKGVRNQAPKVGHEKHTIQRGLERRHERAQYDAVVTHNNAKTDALEGWIKNNLAKHTGAGGNDTQFILFGNRIGSSMRTMEAKLRQMGFQDVNEALGNADVSGEGDRKQTPKKYFVTYMGKGATLGERNLNSEIFRHKQDKFGKDTGVSMFVHRTLYGTTGKPPGLGVIAEGWGRSERKNIAAAFRTDVVLDLKHDKAKGKKESFELEVPMRVMGVAGPKGTVVPNYVYESALDAKTSKRVKDLERLIRTSSGTTMKGHESELRGLLKPYWVATVPLSDKQQYVFNNTQFMCASDAANVGLNWPAAHLAMYDSLFSPLDEWQRITRAARMLPAATSREAKPIVDKIDAIIRANEEKKGASIKDYDHTTALAAINDALDTLDPGDRKKLDELGEGAPDQLIEAYFAKRSLERIQGLQESTLADLKAHGYWGDPEERERLKAIAAAGDGATRNRILQQLKRMYIPPEAVQQSDVVNTIIQQHLSPFERKMMQDRRFLVEVKRFTTSVDIPITEEITIPVAGKKKGKKVTVQTGEYSMESPCNAERSQLMQSRAKMTAVEAFLNIAQNAQPETTDYDFVAASVASARTTSTLNKNDDPLADRMLDESVHYAQELVAKSARYARRFVVHVGGMR